MQNWGELENRPEVMLPESNLHASACHYSKVVYTKAIIRNECNQEEGKITICTFLTIP